MAGPAQKERNIQCVRDCYKALVPHSQEGGYVNFAASDDANRVAANFGRNFDHLREVKAKYDMENVFRINQNVPPKT